MPTLRTLCGLLALALLMITPGHAQQIINRQRMSRQAVKTLRVGESQVYEFDRMTTAAVGSPLVADIVPLSAHRLLVNAKSLGDTTLLVCDGRGTHQWHLTVIPAAYDLGPVAAQVQAEIGLPGVTARAVKDTLFLEGSVPTVIALQRASAIAGVYAPKVKNLLAVTPEADSTPTLAQTYAALLTPPLAGLGIAVQVIDDKTVALTGQYQGRLSAPSRESLPKSSAHARASSRRTLFKSAASSNMSQASSDDAPDPEIDLKDSPTARRGESAAADPLDRLLQSLPSDLKVVDMLNLAPGPTRQILVRAKIIDIDRNSSRDLGIQWGSLNAGSAREGNTYTLQSQPILFGQYTDKFNSSPLGGGSLKRVLPLAAQLNALILENKARVLSEPSLMVCRVSSGESAPGRK